MEISTLLMILGMSPGYADEVSGILRIHSGHSLMIRPVCIAILSLLSNAIFDVTPERMSESYLPPSDQRLQRHVSFFLGTWLFLAWSTGEVKWYSRIHLFLTGPVTYMYEVSQTSHWCWRKTRILRDQLRVSLYRSSLLLLFLPSI